MSLEKAKTAAKNVLERLGREFTHYPAIRDFVERELKLVAAEAEEIFGVAEAPEAPIPPAQPPVDNDHVAEGFEKFSQETIDANKAADEEFSQAKDASAEAGSDEEGSDEEGESQPDNGL